ncbi:MAG: pilus assembly protein PilM [bacterium]
MELSSSGIGIDLSDHHVRLAWVGRKGRTKGLYELDLAHGLIVDDLVVKPEGLAKQIGALINKTGISDETARATVLVPESRVFSKTLVIPRNKDKEALISEARAAAQLEIPIPFSKAYVQVEQAKKSGKEMQMTVFVVQKEVVDGLKKAFSQTSFEFVAAEVGGQALCRLYLDYGLEIPKDRDSLFLVIDIGHSWTNISVFDIMSLEIFSRSVQARRRRSTGKAEPLMQEGIENICNAISETVSFVEGLEREIFIGIVAGVEGGQKEVSEACSKVFKKCPLLRIGDAVEVPGLSKEEIHTYGAALGAALRSVKPSIYKNHHNFYYETEQ